MRDKLPKADKQPTFIGGGSSNIGAGSGDIAREGDGYAIPNGDGITKVAPMKPGI